MTNALINKWVYTHVCVCACVVHLEVSSSIVLFHWGGKCLGFLLDTDTRKHLWRDKGVWWQKLSGLFALNEAKGASPGGQCILPWG